MYYNHDIKKKGSYGVLNLKNHTSKAMKNINNWRLKILAKLILCRLPVNYNFWRKYSLFKFGEMENIEIAEKIYSSYVKEYIAEGKCFDCNTVMLEFGCGDSVFSGLLAKRNGIKKSYLIDAGQFAVSDTQMYIKQGAKIGLNVTASFDENITFEEMLNANDIVYLTNGLESLRTIESSSVDLIWSNAVLEHVRYSEIEDVLIEFRRIIKEDGILIHTVDLRDHLSGGLQNLRFSERIWEADWFAFRSGFYTNRIRFEQMILLMKNHQFSCKSEITRKYEFLQPEKSKMNIKFKALNEEDLKVAGFRVIMKPIFDI